MGMFDYLECQHPLPDGFNPEGREFQTKDTPAQELEVYVLMPDGALIHQPTGERVAFHGALCFYATNLSGSGPHGVITSDDAAPWWAEYCALFDHGTLLKLEGEKALDTSGPHLSRAEFFGHRQS